MMTPIYLSSYPDPSSFPLLDIRGEDDLHDHQRQPTHNQLMKIFFSSSTHNKEASTSTTTYLPCPTHHHQEPNGIRPLIDDQPQVVKDKNLFLHGHRGSVSSSDHSTTSEESQGISILPVSGKNSDQEISCRQTDGNGILSIRWMSSKMRKSSPNSRASRWSFGGDLVKESRDFEYLQEVPYSGRSNVSVNNGTVRVCSDCNTTTTPLWRSGPRGPKSLCNACGIRQRKARRAMEAAAAANSGVANTNSADTSTSRMNNNGKPHSKMMDKKPRTNKKCRSKFKKHITNSNPCHEAEKKKRQGPFESFTIGLSETSSSSGFRRVFPGDEAEAAALLLMEISRNFLTA